MKKISIYFLLIALLISVFSINSYAVKIDETIENVQFEDTLLSDYDFVKNATILTYYHISSVKSKASVNSGTTLNSRCLRMSSIGVDQDGYPVTESEELNLTSSYANPYTSYIPASWPYTAPGLVMGASFECSVSRPGSGGTYLISNNLFNNA